MLNAVPLHQGVMAVVWLSVVLVLILGASRVARLLPTRMFQVNAPVGQAHAAGLALRGSLAIDLRRRVHLVEAAGQTMLILTGGTADVVIALKSPQG